MDHHTLAIISIVGNSLDVLGALYLAYDLLGGEHGPLRALSRGVTYGALFAAGYGIPLGPVFGIACGITHGLTLAWEFSLASRGTLEPGPWHDAAASAIRGIGLSIGAAWYFGPLFGFLFGVITTLGQIGAYRFGIRPTMGYAPALRLRISRLLILTSLNRMAGYGITAALLCIYVAGQPDRALAFALRIGLTVGAVTTVSGMSTPVVEWGADHVPAKSMGVFGVALILTGFALQSVQYWLTLIDAPIR